VQCQSLCFFKVLQSTTSQSEKSINQHIQPQLHTNPATKTARQQQNCEVARGLTAMANTLT
jgi:hypothetical protein